MTTRSLHRRVGQLLVTGFVGDALTPGMRRALAAGERSGVILFRRNVPTFEATLAITRAVREESARADASLPPLIAIDQEGGRVTRLPAPFPTLPAMRALASGGEGMVESVATVVGRGLGHLGIGFDLAPILDVDSNPQNPVIGDRAFSRDPERCAALGLAFARGLAGGGVLACGKHFPGHGDTSVDSHVDLPIQHHDRARLDAVELVPFAAAARGGMDALMTAHVVCEPIDPGVPATFSRRLCTDLLRGELGFTGVLVSDDLEMRAVAARHAPAESAVAAVAAGCDLILVCKDEEAADAAFAAIVREAERDPSFRARVEEAAGRVHRLRELAGARLPRALALPAPWDDPEAVELVERARALSHREAGVDPTELGR